MGKNFSKLQETVEPGVLQSMGPQRTAHDLVTEKQVIVCVLIEIIKWKTRQAPPKYIQGSIPIRNYFTII